MDFMAVERHLGLEAQSVARAQARRFQTERCPDFDDFVPQRLDDFGGRGHFYDALLPYRAIRHGDIIVFTAPYDRGMDLIKRVIGVPGDRVQVIDGVVWRNGERIPDPHAYLAKGETGRSPYLASDNFPPRDSLHPEAAPAPVVVPQGKLFMMGDNRDDSYDSRFWGFADQNDVEGRASVIYFSWNHDGPGVLPLRWNRFGKVLD